MFVCCFNLLFLLKFLFLLIQKPLLPQHFLYVKKGSKQKNSQHSEFVCNKLIYNKKILNIFLIMGYLRNPWKYLHHFE